MTKFEENSMAAIFQNRVQEYGDRACVAYRKDGIFTDLSWNEMDEKIRDTANYLISIGVKKNDKVAVFSPNRYEWWIADLATLSIGAVTVPVYATNSVEETLYVLDDSESKVCFAATNNHLEKVIKAKKKLPKLEQVIIFESPEKKRKDVITLDDAFVEGKKSEKKGAYDKKVASLKADDVASIIYTSGTTGNPKGVMLTNNNFVSNAVNTSKHLTKKVMNDTNVFLSFLPLSHVFERVGGYYIPINNGSKVAFATDMTTLLDDMKEIRPTTLICVPRIFEKIHAAILGQVAETGGLKKIIFQWAMRQAAKNVPYFCQAKERTGFFAKKYNLAEKLVFSKLRAKIGLDRIVTAFSGGAPLSQMLNSL